jgi:hypothetical protein
VNGQLAALAADVTTTEAGSPGIGAFVVTFLLALAVIGLMLSLVRHLRKAGSSDDDTAPAADAASDDDAEGAAPAADDAAPPADDPTDGTR